jgi:hypothetical protein
LGFFFNQNYQVFFFIFIFLFLIIIIFKIFEGRCFFAKLLEEKKKEVGEIFFFFFNIYIYIYKGEIYIKLKKKERNFQKIKIKMDRAPNKHPIQPKNAI